MQPKFLILGDVCTDITLYVKQNSRVNPEDPRVPLLKEVRKQTKTGMVGNFEEFFWLNNAEPIALYEVPSRCIRNRIVDIDSDNYLLRLDTDVTQRPVPLHHIAEHATEATTFILADYNKGSISLDVATQICSGTNKVYVDSKKADLSCFKNATVKVNAQEYNSLVSTEGVKRLIVTLGAAGSVIMDPATSEVLAKCQAANVPVVNVSGAGDVFFSAFIYAEVLLKYSELDSLRFATCAAGLSIEHVETHVPRIEDINERFNQTVWDS